MATIKAVIRKSKVNTKGEAVIYLRYGHQQKVKDLSSGVKVRSCDWDSQNEKMNSVKGIRKTHQTEELIRSKKQSDLIINTQLEQAKSQILEIARKLQLENIEPTPDLVKTKYLSKGKKSTKIDHEIIALFKDFKDRATKSDATKANYKTAIYHLENFQADALNNIPLRLSDLTLSLVDDFQNYLYRSIKKPDMTVGLSDNSVGTTIKNLKVFLRHLKSKGYQIPNILEEIKVPRYNKPIHFLTEQEIEHLRQFNFTEKRLEHVRDLFIFNCFTGLRYSDLHRLDKSHIKNNIVIMVAYKTQRDVFTPLTRIPLEILERYEYQLPKISEQKFNQYIKEVCQRAGITDTVEDITIASGNKRYTSLPKWKIVTSHTAIKTFITMCVNKGIPPKDVAEMTGKSVEIITKHYYGINRSSLVSKMTLAYG